MKKFLSFGILVLGGFLFATNAFAATVFSDDFGANSLGFDGDPIGWNSWSDGGNSGDDAEIRTSSSGNDSASLNGGRFGIALGKDGYFCKTINTSGYNSVQLSYEWRGDSDSGDSSDDGIVEIKPAGTGIFCSDTSGWTQLKNHDLRSDTSWTTQPAFTNSGMDNKSFLLRFRVDTNHDDEHFRIDNILISGTPIVTTGNLTITKNTIGGDNTFSFSGTGAIGNFNLTSVLGTINRTFSSLATGSYTITETVPSGWSKTSDSCSSVTVSSGGTATCSITNTKLGEVHGYKFEDKNGDGKWDEGELGLSGWTIILDDGEDERTATTEENGSYSFFDVFPGTYTIRENLQKGWVQTTENPEPLTVSAGSVIEEVNFGNFEEISVTVYKNVVAPDGETDAEDDHVFEITLTEGEDIGSEQEFSEESSKIYSNLGPGIYTINEIAGDPDYDLLRISNDNDEDASNGVTFEAESGEDMTFTITNGQKKGTLTVIKEVQNPNGGDATSGEFSFYLNENEEETFNFEENEENPLSGSKTVSVDPGMHTVIEVSHEGSYAISYENCTNVYIGSNQSATCTITNSDIPSSKGAITVIKSLPNDDGGDALVSDFPLYVTSISGEEEQSSETSMTNGESQFFDPGNYMISESNPEEISGYTTSMSCSNGETTLDHGNITLVEQESWVCTITNNDMPGILHVIKNLVNDDGNEATYQNFSFQINQGEPIAFEEDGQNDIYLDGNSFYSVLEQETEGYETSYEGCSEIYLSNGGEATCTITNNDTARATLVVKKIVVNDNSEFKKASDFYFKLNGGEAIQFENLTEDGVSGEVTLNLTPGIYSVEEIADSMYDTSYYNCTDITLESGKTYTCTITNNDIRNSRRTGSSSSNSSQEENSAGEVLGAQTVAEGPEEMTTSCSAYINKFLRRGYQNDVEAVKKLQEFLNKNSEANLAVTGEFDLATENALKTFQLTHKDKILAPWGTNIPSGIFYITTQIVVNNMVCPELNLQVPSVLIPFDLNPLSPKKK